MNQKICNLSAEDVAKLLRHNYQKIGMELTENSCEERQLVAEVQQYQHNMWVKAFNDMFTKYADCSITLPEAVQPVFTGYFIAQLRHAFFDAILGYKKKNPAANPNHTTWLYRRQNQHRDSQPKSIGELVGVLYNLKK